MKICIDCKKSLSEDSFYQRKNINVNQCRNCYGIRRREWRLNNLEQNKRSTSASWFRIKYGLSLAQRQRLLEQNNYCCYLCNRPAKIFPSKGLHVDHNHETGKVRGMLCNRCNRGLGFFKDSASELRKAADYLDTYN